MSSDMYYMCFIGHCIWFSVIFLANIIFLIFEIFDSTWKEMLELAHRLLSSKTTFTQQRVQ